MSLAEDGHVQAGIEGDRRRHTRKRVDIHIAVMDRARGNEVHSVAVHDISLSGMAIFSDTYMPELGDALALCLSETAESCSPDHVIEATVVRRSEGVTGICFDSVGILILKDIQRMLRDERNF